MTDCEACLSTRSTRSPFKATSTEAPHPLHRVPIDLGFVDHKYQEGRRVYLSIIYQYSTGR